MFDIDGKIEKDILEIFKENAQEKDWIHTEEHGRILKVDACLYGDICNYIKRIYKDNDSLEKLGVSPSQIESGELTLE